jgi:putative molybdopterin biosynthesis protein
VSTTLVYRPAEVAPLLKISERHVYELIKRGDLPSVRLGRRVVVPKAALEALIGGK